MNKFPGLGILKSKHSPPKVFVYFAIGIFLFLSCVALFIYVEDIVPAEAKHSFSFYRVANQMNFSGELDQLYWVIILIMALAIAILLITINFSFGKTYYLYEKGIVTENSGQLKTILFEDIDDLWLFSSGNSFNPNNIAFRSRKDGHWEIMTARNRHVFKAIDLITSHHQAQYTAKVLKDIKIGNGIVFNYISDAIQDKSFLNLPSKEITVYQHHVVIDEVQLRIEDISHFSTDNNWISLYNRENDIAFTTSLVGFFSSKSFIAVLNRLIRMSNK
ncbi:hypothetical protein [Pedobacter sp. WC2423]|uniref:hypothetical protein n=1 Tax=Pedobacter sp. WC2423 TaxID=3234142 RepID=UPI003467969D